MLMVVGYGEKIIILAVKELPLDLAYLCIISLKYSRKLAQVRSLAAKLKNGMRNICEAVKITITTRYNHHMIQT